MKVVMGNHSKIQVDRQLRQKVKDFYLTLLGCQSLPSPLSALELFGFPDGFIFGVYFVDESETLSDDEHVKATWLELKTADPAKLQAQLISFGVKQIDYPDKAHFYFQAPGGQVFRVAGVEHV